MFAVFLEFEDYNPFPPKNQYAYSPYYSPYISYGNEKENLFNI